MHIFMCVYDAAAYAWCILAYALVYVSAILKEIAEMYAFPRSIWAV